MTAEHLRDLVPCEKCHMHSLKVLETRKVLMSNARRRRYECTSCSHRATRYEVTEEFYKQAIENERILHQLRLYIDRKPGVVNKHTKDCTTCEYNMINIVFLIEKVLKFTKLKSRYVKLTLF